MDWGSVFSPLLFQSPSDMRWQQNVGCAIDKNTQFERSWPFHTKKGQRKYRKPVVVGFEKFFLKTNIHVFMAKIQLFQISPTCSLQSWQKNFQWSLTLFCFEHQERPMDSRPIASLECMLLFLPLQWSTGYKGLHICMSGFLFICRHVIAKMEFCSCSEYMFSSVYKRL